MANAYNSLQIRVHSACFVRKMYGEKHSFAHVLKMIALISSGSTTHREIQHSTAEIFPGSFVHGLILLINVALISPSLTETTAIICQQSFSFLAPSETNSKFHYKSARRHELKGPNWYTNMPTPPQVHLVCEVAFSTVAAIGRVL